MHTVTVLTVYEVEFEVKCKMKCAVKEKPLVNKGSLKKNVESVSMLVLVNRVKRIFSSLVELFSKTILELFERKKIFLSEFILHPGIATLTINAIPMRRIFFILQNFP